MNDRPKHIKRAAALAYKGKGAPILIAKGEGDHAHLIVYSISASASAVCSTTDHMTGLKPK